MEWINALLRDAGALSQWEAVAVVLALAYVLLAAKESLWCWPAALFSTAIYTVIFWEVALLMESVLNAYYMVMAVYGFWLWRKGDKGSHTTIQRWRWQRHLVWAALMAAIALVVGYVMATYTSADYPWLDAATTVFAVFATWLVAQKVLENWLYWIVIDIVSIYLYLNKGLLLTSALFVLYVGIAAAGYWLWYQRLYPRRPRALQQPA